MAARPAGGAEEQAGDGGRAGVVGAAEVVDVAGVWRRRQRRDDRHVHGVRRAHHDEPDAASASLLRVRQRQLRARTHFLYIYFFFSKLIYLTYNIFVSFVNVSSHRITYFVRFG